MRQHLSCGVCLEVGGEITLLAFDVFFCRYIVSRLWAGTSSQSSAGRVSRMPRWSQEVGRDIAGSDE